MVTIREDQYRKLVGDAHDGKILKGFIHEKRRRFAGLSYEELKMLDMLFVDESDVVKQDG